MVSASSRPSPSLYTRSEEHTSELQSQSNLVCRLLLEKKKTHILTSIFNPILRLPHDDRTKKHDGTVHLGGPIRTVSVGVPAISTLDRRGIHCTATLLS